jgi:hypothetical protein
MIEPGTYEPGAPEGGTTWDDAALHGRAAPHLGQNCAVEAALVPHERQIPWPAKCSGLPQLKQLAWSAGFGFPQRGQSMVAGPGLGLRFEIKGETYGRWR